MTEIRPVSELVDEEAASVTDQIKKIENTSEDIFVDDETEVLKAVKAAAEEAEAEAADTVEEITADVETAEEAVSETEMFAEEDTAETVEVKDTAESEDVQPATADTDEAEPAAEENADTVGEITADEEVTEDTASEEAVSEEAEDAVLEETEEVTSEESEEATSEEEISEEAVSDDDGDTLLAQIDAFREKALQLAAMINEKENRAKELEGKVADFEAKNQALEEELNAKQEEADSLKVDVESQVSRMLGELKSEMDKMGIDISDRVAACQLNLNTDDITASIGDYLDNVNKTILSSKNELADKYHSENVRLYRNIQDLMKELDNSDEIILKSRQQYESLKSRFGIVMGLLVLNFVIALCLLILNLNIF